ncbi:hypothetical protein [Nocardioides sp. AE5]|uniref:hypothetical protein n=1 Tax=Nocardioides sp. AE5 TaxID=2962573 RepID=UPI002881EE43|nr:hypothetical protein [Nocardioides sp. AE5]MDT0203486.1 hypothetical protein [Nocardioides sp. AE5]
MGMTFTRAHARLVLASVLATGLVAAVLTVPEYKLTNTVSLAESYEASRPVQAADGHWHTHDPERKNDISQSGEMDAQGAVAANSLDPTSAAEARENTAYVATQRDLVEPELVPASFTTPRAAVPEDRYAVAGGCYELNGQPITFRATDLGVHLLYTNKGTFITGHLGSWVHLTNHPSALSEWTTEKTADGFTFQLHNGRYLTVKGGALVTSKTPGHFDLHTTTGCKEYPEVEVNVTGDPHAGLTPYQEVRGYVDAHVHGMAFEFLGGEIHCGRPWHKYGAAYALPDCSNLLQPGTKGAPLDVVLSGQAVRDPVGWPTFKGWPAPDALTHEGTYYKWMERSWRGGQRVFVNLLVENGKLCEIYPLKRNSCDDMESAKLQAQDMRALERYIDAQYGGPGKGWYRIVTDPFEARQVINEGKLAVVMGVEVSIPFGCTMFLGTPACDTASIEAQLDELYDLGVRQMEIVNKFDNALAGVAGDEGVIGPAVNLANFLETGSFWKMETCDPADGESADKTQLALPNVGGDAQDALFGAIMEVAGIGVPLPAPLYGRPMHCNQLGLTDLGAFTIDALMERNMLIDPDHMSVKARQATLDQLEAAGYSGVISSHSWSTPDAYPRIYALGGFVAPMAGDSTGFYEKWQRHIGWADERFYFGFGWGADINGLANQGDPRGADAANPVSYPFTGLGGVRVEQQVSGERVYDLNVDGVAHYGLYPDWVEDLRMVGGEDGDAIVADLARGAEAFLQTWERAHGIAPDSCRNPELRATRAAWDERVHPGMTTVELMAAVGQPFARLGSTYSYCGRGSGASDVEVTVRIDADGRVTGVTWP